MLGVETLSPRAPSALLDCRTVKSASTRRLAQSVRMTSSLFTGMVSAGAMEETGLSSMLLLESVDVLQEVCSPLKVARLAAREFMDARHAGLLLR